MFSINFADDLNFGLKAKAENMLLLIRPEGQSN